MQGFILNKSLLFFMRKILLIGLLSIHSFLLKGQNNLVPNWSFENILDCNPHNGGDLIKAVPWFAAQTFCSTDLFNTCDTNFFHVPNNFFGYQDPRSGNGYAGLIPFEYPTSSPTYREYAEVKLLDSLNAGKSYCISYYINPSDNYCDCYINSISAVLSYDTLKPPADSLLIDMAPDISPSGVISDTINWTKVSGVYNCTNTKKFITLGNFFNNYNTSFVCALQNGSYYNIDDVSVVEVSNANAGNDTTMCVGNVATIGGLPTFEAEYTWYELADSINSNSIDSIHIAKPHISPTQTTTYVMWKRQCNVITTDTVIVTVNCVGLQQEEKKPKLMLYPNPANDQIGIGYTGTASELRIFDLLGKEIKKLPLKEGTTIVETASLVNGLYFFNIVSGGRTLVSEKVLIQH
jgi:hypothetical protein